MFLKMKKGNIDQCTFKSKGRGGMLAIIDIFDNQLKTLDSRSSVSIYNCIFENDEENKISVDYYSEYEKGCLEMDHIKFKGKFSKNSKYISRKLMKQNKIQFKDCIFEFDSKQVLMQNIFIFIFCALEILIAFTLIQKKKFKKENRHETPAL